MQQYETDREFMSCLSLIVPRSIPWLNAMWCIYLGAHRQRGAVSCKLNRQLKPGCRDPMVHIIILAFTGHLQCLL